MEIFNAPQQRLAAMQDDGKIGQRVRSDVLLDTREQLPTHLIAHQLGLVIDGRVAEPIAIGAVDVAARRNLYKELRDRLVPKSERSWIIGRHGEPRLPDRALVAPDESAFAEGAGSR